VPKQNGPSAFGGRAEAVLHVSGVLQTLSIIQEHYHLFLVAISGAYLFWRISFLCRGYCRLDGISRRNLALPGMLESMQ
jgi:hypothetical protein